MRFDRKHDWSCETELPVEPPRAAKSPAPSEIKLEGPGPFHLPACQEHIEIFDDGEVAVVIFTTMLGHRVAVPIPSFALRNLGLALISAAGTRPERG